MLYTVIFTWKSWKNIFKSSLCFTFEKMYIFFLEDWIRSGKIVLYKTLPFVLLLLSLSLIITSGDMILPKYFWESSCLVQWLSWGVVKMTYLTFLSKLRLKFKAFYICRLTILYNSKSSSNRPTYGSLGLKYQLAL